MLRIERELKIKTKLLETLINEEMELNEYIDSIYFDDLWGKNRFALKHRKLRQKIKRLEERIEDLEIRKMENRPKLKKNNCNYCSEEIEIGTRKYIYTTTGCKRFCSNSCQKLFRNRI